MLQRTCGREQVKNTIDLPGGIKPARRRQNHSTARLGKFDTGEIHGRALARMCAFDGNAMHLEAADAGADTGGIQLHFIVNRKSSRDQCACDYGAMAAHGKAAIDG
jgi:hypothetical protein